MKVLILNHTHEKCGVYQFGKRIYDLVSKSTKIDFIYKCIKNKTEYFNILAETSPDYIIYNWHWDRMPWLTEADIVNNKSAKHYFIYHDGSMVKNYDKYLFFGELDPNKTDAPENKRILLPRPLYKYDGEYKNNNIVTIGSFGFAFYHKNFPDLITKVNKEFDQAIVNIHLTRPYFGDSSGGVLGAIVKDCHRRNSKKFKVNITEHFLSDQELLKFLAKNDINIFNYSEIKNPGLSSALDYALSVKRPIALSNNMMFRHVFSKEISLEKNSITSIINKGLEPIKKYHENWSTDNFTKSMEDMFLSPPIHVSTKKTVLLLNHKIANCGVYQFGKRLYEAISKSSKINFEYKEVETVEEFNALDLPQDIIFNWHRATMGWALERLHTLKSNYHFVFHDEIAGDYPYLFFGDYDVGSVRQKIILPRPLFNYTGPYSNNKTFTIGSFGFGFWQKGFEVLVEQVNKEFDKAIINLHMPHSHFGDPNREQTPAVIKKCKEVNKNPNIKLNITEKFLTNEGILEFLAKNDINAFLYHENGTGISSATDYALSVDRPLIITDCQMFRHFKNDKITINKNSIFDVYCRGLTPLKEAKEKWTVDNLITRMEKIYE